MALQTIRLGNFAGVKQGACAGTVPLNWAEDAQNVSTTGGRLSRVKGYRALYPPVTGMTQKLRRLFLWPRNTGAMDVVVARQDSLYRYDAATETWFDVHHYANNMTADVFDFLKTKIGSTEVLLLGNGLEPISKWEGGSASIVPFGSAEYI